MLLQACAVQCSQGKGFGSGSSTDSKSKGKGKKQGLAGVKSSDSKAVQRAVRLVEKQEAAGRRQGVATRPVDPHEAARGKVEYVKVKDWGSGNPQDLGSLQLESDAKQVFASGGSGSSCGTSEDEAPPAMPFHETLARRLEMLQTQGALGVAQLQGSKPLPPFERWTFAQQHYVQYLADMYAVHDALEDNLAASQACIEAELGGSGEPGSSGAQHQQRQLLLGALQLFGRKQGLGRAPQLQQDIANLAARQQQAAAQLEAGSQAPAASAASTAAAGAAPADVPPPTQHAAAYGAYIASLGRLVQAAEGLAEQQQAVLRLLAHAYIVHLMHLTSGGRISAAAAEKLQLAAADALHFHMSYPDLPAVADSEAPRRPLELFVENTNSLGRLLSEDQQEEMMQELAKAMTKSSMLLVPLARES